MNVAYLSSEVAPFAKTGGLADMAGAIPRNLQKLGVKIMVLMPLYRSIKESACPLVKTDIRFEVRIGNKIKSGSVYKGFLPDSQVSVYFIDNEQYYGRDGLYNYPGIPKDFEDNSERFIFFSLGVLEVVERLRLRPDIVHCNDWQTGLVPVYLKTRYAGRSFFENTKSVMTIHNLAYQGCFWHWDMKLTGLDWSLFNAKQLEFYGKLNFLKGGIVFSDLITTVSKTYAAEIQTPEYGVGLDGVLRERAGDLYGIMNGIDYALWNPETDKFICANYGSKNLRGKQLCKKALQKKYNLPKRDCPLIGMITRLTDQKGLDLVVDKFQDLMKMDIQLVLLGTGDPWYHEVFKRYARTYPAKVAIQLSFDERSAHEIEAGADIFLMPSRYEPCGLNQLYSLKYGTVPVVRSTGGLADTITDVRQAPVKQGRANGFSFKNYNADLLFATIVRAVDLFKDKTQWKNLMINGMSQDWSLEKSAKEYLALYEKMVKKG
ncbi:MAG: glycogen synthase GlgA [Candidatus Brocadia sp.]|uniref:Glycogen synthase n=1 Tax=Candidatus Brocadia fulgida TaxID=380242 RepID=A0A0M2UXD3_9BACT|nr:MAG: glycogen synthase [Candidatus Brocadia fulgida]MCC6325565.1 glycogen synthase GlgA [Candidatus Brocadia sp.]MCE7912230.1 glycogen synthase GlgA [Candidatus Brocadia sp. AMX3]OQZ01238.1 MAG: starch synthase [Candidatus Brocadia sp. UTAMX2]MBV6518331.1 Glycogen synthase [Candidatus Brocadia fulgida]